MKEEFVDHEYVLAEPERIWDILTDVDDWPQRPAATHVELPAGPLCEGATFSAEHSGHRWKMVVTEADKPRRLVWVGHSRGLTSRHEWQLTPMATGTCEVVTKKTVSAWMLPLTHPPAKRRVPRDDARWLTYLTRQAEGRSVERP